MHTIKYLLFTGSNKMATIIEKSLHKRKQKQIKTKIGIIVKTKNIRYPAFKLLRSQDKTVYKSK